MMKMMICLSSKCHEYSNNRKRSLWILESPNRTKILFKYRPQFLQDWQKGREPEWAWPPAFFSALSFLIFSFFFHFFCVCFTKIQIFPGSPCATSYPRVHGIYVRRKSVAKSPQGKPKINTSNSWHIMDLSVQLGNQSCPNWFTGLKGLPQNFDLIIVGAGISGCVLLNKPLEDTIWKVW